MPSILSELYPLKTASADEIVAETDKIADRLQGFATQVRQVISGGSNGRNAISPGGTSEKKAMQIAILAILLDEMSYAPSVVQREGQVGTIEQVCARLNVSHDEVMRCSRRAAQLVKALDGN
jgi:hypothetical protein